MRYLVLGATGFIGRHICAALLAAGQEVTGAARRTGVLARAFPSMRVVPIDLATASEGDWLRVLAGIDIVVNVAGQLNRDLDAVHVEGPIRLYRAARQVGVKRVVLISAISARPDVTTSYAAPNSPASGCCVRAAYRGRSCGHRSLWRAAASAAARCCADWPACLSLPRRCQ